MTQFSPSNYAEFIQPVDEYNLDLIANVHPLDWVNPQPAALYDLVVIGAGTAGLVVAAGAAGLGLGLKVALIEKNLMGGDCLNFGCVPSKCMIRSSRVVAEIRDAARFGINPLQHIDINFTAVMERMRKIRAGISHHDSAARFQKLGVDVFLGSASFIDDNAIAVNDHKSNIKLNFKKAVIATGARAAEPNITGLTEAGYLTNETIFSLTERPKRLAVLGGGAIGCELAQALQRLGCEVTLLHKNSHLLDREDADAAEVLQQVFLREGVNLILDCAITKVTKTSAGKIIDYQQNGINHQIEVDEILVGVGRSPNVEGLNLEAVAVKYNQQWGVFVNDYLQTTNPRIFAAGDI
ncbi:MAG: FAD-dependent oxidoreductase, partial [Pseudanabaena sp.]